MFHLEKEKYIRILKSEGVQAALTQLHRDTNEWEYITFEGRQGWSPQMWEALKQVREFSRELWQYDLDRNPNPSMNQPRS